MMRRLWTVVCACLLLATATCVLAGGPNDPTDATDDPDGDKLVNIDEFRAGTNPLLPDTDFGGCWDGWEVIYGLDPTNPLDDAFDSDNDGWTNLREFLEGTNPRNPNTDTDCYPLDSTDPRPLVPDGPWDGEDGGVGPGPNPLQDTDRDGLPDVVEPRYGTNPFEPDLDRDGLLDGREVEAETDPHNPDSDGDGLLDGQEVQKDRGDIGYTGTNPLSRDSDGDGVDDYHDDSDGDTLPNGEEFRYSDDAKAPLGRQYHTWTNPREPDTDGDTVWDGREVYGNPDNGDQTSDPLLRDTDGDRLTDDIDPNPREFDLLPQSVVSGLGNETAPTFPTVVMKGVPFNVVGRIMYEPLVELHGTSGALQPIEFAMKVQVWLEQDGRLFRISDASVTGAGGMFKIACVIGDEIHAGQGTLVITTTFHKNLAYLPGVWTEPAGNQ